MFVCGDLEKLQCSWKHSSFFSRKFYQSRNIFDIEQRYKTAKAISNKCEFSLHVASTFSIFTACRGGRIFEKKICDERILNEIAKVIDETFVGLNCMPQGFRIYFV